MLGSLRPGRIGAVDWEMREQLDQRAAQRRAAEFRTLGARQAVERAGAGLELRREAARDDLAAGGALLIVKICAASADGHPQPGERGFAARIMLDRAGVIHEIVAAGP